MNRNTTFEKNDHRYYNRHGEAFDVNETFAGVPFNIGLEAVEELKKIKPEGITMDQFALKWILMHKAVSTVIPGGKKIYQVEDNAGASELPPLSDLPYASKTLYLLPATRSLSNLSPEDRGIENSNLLFRFPHFQ